VDIGYFDSRMRLNPPLRQQRDRDALRAALADGTIDALVSDHNPVSATTKHCPLREAEPGATGLELLLSLALKWAQEQRLRRGGSGSHRHQPFSSGVWAALRVPLPPAQAA